MGEGILEYGKVNIKKGIINDMGEKIIGMGRIKVNGEGIIKVKKNGEGIIKVNGMG